MADNSAEVLLSRRVQELVVTGEDPPALYVCRDANQESEDERNSVKDSPVPVIDIGKLSNHEQSREELDKLKLALSEWGCFQATGHGIPSSFLDEVLQVGREFFELPMEEKKKYEKGLTDFEGYGADPIPEQGQPVDWSDRIVLFLEPKDERNYKLWPQNPPSFIKTIEDFGEKMKSATEVMNKAMARSLNLEENCFLKQFGERARVSGRYNYYAPCKWHDRVLGLKPHADGSAYTIILQDEPGLQILNQGKWFTVPKNPGTFIVINADQMEIMSNGIFKSVVHRVVSDPKRDRISIAMFYLSESGSEIGPEEGLISAETPRLFKKVKGYADTHWEHYDKGMRALYTAQV